MSHDLARALDAVAARATAAADPVPVDHLLTRLHRRRAARTAVASGLALAVVGAVAVAAVALPGRLAPAPPAERTSVPTATAEPSPTAATDSPWPVSARLADDVACGAPLPGLEDPPDYREVYFFTQVAGWPAVAGEPVGIRTDIAVGLDDAELYGRARGGPQLVVLRDGVVVGLADLTAPGAGAGEVVMATVPTGGPTTRASVVLEACDGTGPLPAGDYEILAWQTLDPVTGDEVGRPELGTLGGPEPLRLAGTPEGLRIMPPGTQGLPGCGDAFTAEPTDDPGIQFRGDVASGSSVEGGFRVDETGRLFVVFAVEPQGDPHPINGNLDQRAYLLDDAGRVAFWDDPDLMVGDGVTWLWDAVDCRTGEPLTGTYRAVVQAVLWPWPGMPETPVTEVVELPAVTVAP